MKKNYEELDRKIVAAIGAGNSDFTALAIALRVSLPAFATKDRFGLTNEDRVLDRRLQALRRRGAVEYARGGIGWRIPS